MTNLPAYVVVKERRGRWAVGVFGNLGPMRAVHLFSTEAAANAYAKAANDLAAADVALTTSYRL